MKHPLGIRAAISAVLLCAAGTVIAADQPANDPHAGHAMSAGSSGKASSGNSGSASMQMHQAMMDGMKEMHAMQPTGDVDKDFASMIEHHHAQAVKMTQAYLKGAKDPKLRAWAQKSLEGQQKELKELRALNVSGSTAGATPGSRQ